MKSFVATVLVALLFILALIFGARNEQVVTISYFVAQGEYRLPVVLAIVFCWFHLELVSCKLLYRALEIELSDNEKETKPSDG